MPYNWCGLMRAKVYTDKGELIRRMSEYVMFGVPNGDHICSDIADLLHDHAKKYLPKDESGKNVWQTGFGGDEGDGLIDYALDVEPPDIPDMEFVVDGKTYIMKFYSVKLDE